MVAPAPGNLQVALGRSLESKPKALNQCLRPHIGRLDVRFEPVQLELAKRILDHRRQARCHEAARLEGSEGVVAKIRILKQASNNLVEFHHPDQLISSRLDQQVAGVTG